MEDTYYVASWYVGEGEGLTKIVYDKENNILIENVRVTDTKRTSFFARNNDILYVLTEGMISNPDTSVVTSFKMTDEGLSYIDCSDNFSSACPHISLSSDKKHAYICGYYAGELYMLDTDEEGHLSNLRSVYKNEGSSINPRRQTSSHLHFSMLTPDEEYLCSCDLGTDEILIFSVDPLTSELTKVSSVKTPLGYGPRHMVFSKDGQYAYVLCEMSYHLLVFSYNGHGVLTLVNDIDLSVEAPEDCRQCSAIKLSEDGSMLFTGDRGKGFNNIDAIDLSDPSNPTKIASLTGCNSPRDFILLDNGYIAICNQDGNNIQFVQFKDGHFIETGLIENVKMPVSIIKY